MNISRKDKIASRVGYVIMSLGVVYGALFLTYFGTSLGWYPISASFCCLAGVLLIMGGYSVIGRLLITNAPVIFNCIFHASMVGSDELVISSLYISQFGMLLTSMIVFDLKDRKSLFCSAGMGLLILACQAVINRMIPDQMNGTEVLVGTWVDTMTYIFSAILVIVPLYWFQLEVFNSDKKNARLIEELKRYQERLLSDNQNLYAEHIEMSMLNNLLERKIFNRTEKLREQNKLLAEQSYINSHLLRAPLCRLSGLMNLIDQSQLSENNEEILTYMESSIHEMNEITMSIAMMLEQNGLYPNNTVNLNDIKQMLDRSASLAFFQEEDMKVKVKRAS